MITARRIAPFVLLAALLSGCGGEDPSGPSVADLVGSWTATSDTHTNNANSSETFDMVAGGGSVDFTMLAGGGTRTWVEFGTFSDEWDAAVSVSGSTLTSDPVESGRPTRVWLFTLVGGVLTMTRTDSEWDFTQTGATPVSTTEVIVFVRS